MAANVLEIPSQISLAVSSLVSAALAFRETPRFKEFSDRHHDSQCIEATICVIAVTKTCPLGHRHPIAAFSILKGMKANVLGDHADQPPAESRPIESLRASLGALDVQRQRTPFITPLG